MNCSLVNRRRSKMHALLWNDGGVRLPFPKPIARPRLRNERTMNGFCEQGVGGPCRHFMG